METTETNPGNAPRVGIDRFYVDSVLLDEVWREFNKKSLIWQSGLEAPGPIEQLAYLALKNATLWTKPEGTK